MLKLVTVPRHPRLFRDDVVRPLVIQQRIMEGRSLPEISIEVTWDRAYVRMALEQGKDTDWETIKALLSYLGFDVRFVQVVFSPAVPAQSKANVICFPVRGKRR